MRLNVLVIMDIVQAARSSKRGRAISKISATFLGVRVPHYILPKIVKQFVQMIQWISTAVTVWMEKKS